MDIQKYKDPRIKAHYDLAETFKKRDPNFGQPTFQIDLTKDSEPYDFDELGDFFREAKINRVSFVIDDMSKFEELVNRTSNLGKLPVEQIESMFFYGNLNGLRNPNYVLRGQGEDLHTVPLENLRFLYFVHDAPDVPRATLTNVAVPRKAISINFQGVDGCQRYSKDPKMESNSMFVDVDRWNDDLRLGALNRCVPVIGYASKGKKFNLEEFKKVSNEFPDLYSYQRGEDGKYTSIPEVEKEDLLHTVEMYGVAKSEPGQLEALKYQLAKEDLEGKSSVFKSYYLMHLVEFPDGTYQNTARTALFKAQDFMTLAKSGQLPDDRECTILINKAKELSLEDAMKLKEMLGDRNVAVRMDEIEGDHFSSGSYTLDKYIAAQEVINEMVADIDPNLDEAQRAAIIYERTARALTYDFEAAYPRTPEEEIYKKMQCYDSRNYDGLLRRTGVCSLNALVYRTACEMNGLECRMVGGPVNVLANHKNPDNVYDKPKDVVKELKNDFFIARDGHSWNQIRVNGQWYVMDPTHDKMHIERGEMPSRAFVSDQTMKRMGYVLEKPYEKNEPCTTDMPPTEVAKIVGIKDTRGRFKRAIDFVRNEPLAAARRHISFDKDILEYSTGEKFKEAVKDIERRGVIEELPHDMAKRKIVEMIKRVTTPALPEPIAPLTIEAPKEAKENAVKQANVWDLTPEQARNVNVQEAVKQTQRNSIDRNIDDQTRNDNEENIK